jgi:hypothetical protein
VTTRGDTQTADVYAKGRHTPSRRFDVTDSFIAHGRRPSRPSQARDDLEGLILTAAIGSVGFALREIRGLGLFSPMILSMIVGMVFNNVVGTPLRAKAGVVFSLRRILRLAIILLGLQPTA